MTSCNKTILSRTNSFYKIPKPIVGNNEIAVGNVCYCIQKGFPESSNADV